MMKKMTIVALTAGLLAGSAQTAPFFFYSTSAETSEDSTESWRELVKSVRSLDQLSLNYRFILSDEASLSLTPTYDPESNTFSGSLDAPPSEETVTALAALADGDGDVPVSISATDGASTYRATGTAKVYVTSDAKGHAVGYSAGRLDSEDWEDNEAPEPTSGMLLLLGLAGLMLRRKP